MRIAIIGGGLTGMSVADELTKHGHDCVLYEKDETLGGLAGSFRVDDVYLEKFYHHLFTSDTAMVDVIERMGLGDKFEWLPTNNSYFAGQFYRLSTPIDLLKFTHIPFVDRIRLGLLYVRTMFVKEWQPLEGITARDWLVGMIGERAYQAVWEPLLRSKFGQYADKVAAVWIWNKLKLRGSSRGDKQEERLGYLREGFGQAIDAWHAHLAQSSVEIKLSTPVEEVRVVDGRATGVVVDGQFEAYDAVFATLAPPLLAEMAPGLSDEYAQRLRAIDYLANVCLVMEVDRSLSETYWLNIGDPSIPFTGVIEHTNMQDGAIYGGRHIVYISRYLDAEDPLYAMSAEEILDAYIPHLAKMFKGFERSWVNAVYAWRERWTQPVIGLHYSQLKPPTKTPVKGLWLSSMAQVYPEDRGMNYAVVYGQRAAQEFLATL